MTTTQKLYAPQLSEYSKKRQLYFAYKDYNLNIYNSILNKYVFDVNTKFNYAVDDSLFLTISNLDTIVKNTKSYPSVVTAMAIIESGWGKYAIGGNNYFGIKGSGHYKLTKEWDGEKFITIIDSFKHFKSMTDGIKAHSTLLHNSNYNIGSAKTYMDAVNMIYKGGYATDPDYVSKITFIIKTYELHRLDELKDHYDKFLT